MFFPLPNGDHRCKVNKYECHTLTRFFNFFFFFFSFSVRCLPFNVLTMPVDYLFFNFNVFRFLTNLQLCFLITRGNDNQSLNDFSFSSAPLRLFVILSQNLKGISGDFAHRSLFTGLCEHYCVCGKSCIKSFCGSRSLINYLKS